MEKVDEKHSVEIQIDELIKKAKGKPMEEVQPTEKKKKSSVEKKKKKRYLLYSILVAMILQ